MQGSATNQLEALKSISKVVADTGDLEAIKKYQPYDATTNPTLVLKAISLPDHKPLLGEAIAKEKGSAAAGARSGLCLMMSSGSMHAADQPPV